MNRPECPYKKSDQLDLAIAWHRGVSDSLEYTILLLKR